MINSQAKFRCNLWEPVRVHGASLVQTLHYSRHQHRDTPKVNFDVAGIAGVPLSWENAPPEDSTVVLCPGPYGGPRGWAFSYERGTPVHSGKILPAPKLEWREFLPNSLSSNYPLSSKLGTNKPPASSLHPSPSTLHPILNRAGVPRA